MKVRFVINSQGRQDRGHLETVITRVLRGVDFDVRLTEYHGHATDIARESERDGVNSIVAVGGDGTINEILNGIIGTQIALGVIPTGTANDLASYCQIPKDIKRACEIVRDRRIRRADTIRVNDWHYLTVGGIGIPCDAIAAARRINDGLPIGNRLIAALGSKSYVLGLSQAMLNPGRWRHPVSIRFNNTALHTDAFSLTAGNQPELGGHFRLSPEATNNDGLMAICLIENCRSRTQLLKSVLRTFSGSHTHAQNVRTFTARSVTIESPQPIPFFGDGEIIQNDSHFHLKVLPRAVRLIVP
jgi:YegS/Rv2252/BmrU family lipid kinase